jgi:pimeloyl-ACP methyl ester carboxylesterase
MTALLVFLLGTLPLLDPKPTGRLVDLGGHRVHINCTGRGQPTVVIETGLGDFSFDWILVQRRVEHDTRVCTYDRGGYAWSDPGPEPRTFDQLNLELHDTLSRAGEHGPFVLVGHSFGGGPVRTFAARYRAEVAGLVLVDIVSENQYIPMGPHAGRIGDGAKGRKIPEPREDMRAGEATARPRAAVRARSDHPTTGCRRASNGSTRGRPRSHRWKLPKTVSVNGPASISRNGHATRRKVRSARSRSSC